MYARLRLKVGDWCRQPNRSPTNFPEVSLRNITRAKADLYQVRLLGAKTRDKPRRLHTVSARQMLHKTITDGWLPSAIGHIAEVYPLVSGCHRGVQL